MRTTVAGTQLIGSLHGFLLACILETEIDRSAGLHVGSVEIYELIVGAFELHDAVDNSSRSIGVN